MSNDDPGSVRWFGQSWHAPVNELRAQIPVPVGENCIYCHLPILSDDSGLSVPGPPLGHVVFHKRCFFNEIGVPDGEG